MKKLNRSLSLLFVGLSVSNLAQAETLLMSVRNSSDMVQKYCISKKCKLAEVQNDVVEFANGNTFVRLKQPVAGQDIVVLTPSQIDFNQFLELLIKVRTTKSEFANSVKVVTEKGSQILEVVDQDGKSILNPDLVLDLLAEAGTNQMDGRKIHASKLPRVLKSRRTVVVDMGTNSTLAKNISNQLSVAVMSLSEAQETLKSQDANVILVSSVADPHNLSLLQALQGVRNLKSLGAKVTLVSPYLPYARSDKKDQAGVSVIGRLAADIIQKSGADAVQFVRAHAPQSQGFFSIPTIQTMGRKTINEYLKSVKVEQIVSPDAGFQKDATLYADDLSVPVSVINKQRDLTTGESKLHDMSGPSVTGKTVAIIDDETASGGTLGKAAQFLKKQGATKVVAVVTHLAGNASQALNSPDIDEMVVTDTFEIKTQFPKLKVLSLANEVGHDLKQMLGVLPTCSKGYRE